MKRTLIWALPILLVGSAQSQTTSSSTEGKVLRTTSPGSVSSEWVKWNKSSCSYEPAVEHPPGWTAELRATSAPVKFGFAEQGENAGWLVDVNTSVKNAAKEAGIDLAIGNYNYPSTTDPISQSAAMALQKPAAVISFHVIANLLEPTNANFERLCIPIVQVTVPYKNVPRFGLSNQDAGTLMGQFLSNWAAKENWQAAEAIVVVSRNPVYGADVTDRMTKCADAASAKLSGVKIEYLDVGSDSQTAQVAMTNWLTAHPNNHKILACGFSDAFAIGFANAFEAARRVNDGVIVGTGGSDQARQMIKAGSAFRGTVNQRFDTYGLYLVPMVQDILAGKPIPAVVHQKLEMMDKSNI